MIYTRSQSKENSLSACGYSYMKNGGSRLRALNAVLMMLFIAACGGGGNSSAPAGSPPVSFTYSAPEYINDGWNVAHLDDEGIDSQQIIDMMNLILNGTYPGIDSVAIAKNNKLVLYWFDENRPLHSSDWQINNTDRERHILASTTKSFTSALIGIAIDQGYIGSTQVKLLNFFSYPEYANWDPRKADISLEDVLTMRLGFVWDEWELPYSNPNNDLVYLENNNNDWIKALLDLPVAHDPGTEYTYNTAASIALGQVLENTTGIPMADFANNNLFLPMQIINADWWLTPTGLPNGGSGLFLTNRDLAKFGQLYIDGGIWQGQQVISAEWIADSVTQHVDISSWSNSEGYGFQWWIDRFSYNGQPVEAWTTKGYGGQYLFAIPSLDLVVSFTGRNRDNGVGPGILYTMTQTVVSAVN